MNRLPRFVLPAILLGAALVAFPFFFLRLALFVVVAGLAFRFVRRWSFGGGGGGMTFPSRWNRWQSRRMDFADRIRHMSDDEYAAFSQQQPQFPATDQRDSVGRSWGGSRDGFVL